MTRTLKHSPLWALVIALLMAAQLALAFHSVEHKFDGDSLGEHCALCQVAATMVPAPAADPIAAPTLHELTEVIVNHAQQPRVFPAPSNFLSRAPPVTVSL